MKEKVILIMCSKCVLDVFKLKKRVQVTFTESQWNLLESFRGELGEGDADIIRNIVIAWLAEKSFIASFVKNKNTGGQHEDKS